MHGFSSWQTSSLPLSDIGDEMQHIPTDYPTRRAVPMDDGDFKGAFPGKH